MCEMNNNKQNNSEVEAEDIHKEVKPIIKIWLGLMSIVEAIIVTIFSIYFAFNMVTGSTTNFAGALVILLIVAVISIILWISAIASFTVKSWPNGIIFTWQILQLAPAFSLISAGQSMFIPGVLLVALSIATLVLVTVRIRHVTSDVF